MLDATQRQVELVGVGVGAAEVAPVVGQQVLDRQAVPGVERPRRERGREPSPRPERPVVDPLTERELEVLKLVAHGKSNREIADELVVSEGTVRTHVSNVLSKLHLASRTQATLYALREGLTSLADASTSLDDGHSYPQSAP